jgi:UDP-3-O-[3-hydroxymyristoyl] glucosamine N-acyltransferase
MLGGQVGLAGHIVIADDVKIGAQAGLASTVHKPGSILLGAPAIDISRFRRIIAIFNNLDKLYNRIGDLEKTIKQLQAEKISDEKNS